MARIEDGAATVYAGADTTLKALHTTPYPQETTAWQSIAATSGAVANSGSGVPVFSFRNLGPSPILIRRFALSSTCTVFAGSTTADYALFMARSFIVSDSGGTAVSLVGSNTKFRSSLATPAAVDCRISNTAELTPGTRTIDANSLSQCGAFVTALGVVSPTTNLIRHDPSDYPIIIDQNEGVVLQSMSGFASSISVKIYVTMEFAIVT